MAAFLAINNNMVKKLSSLDKQVLIDQLLSDKQIANVEKRPSHEIAFMIIRWRKILTKGTSRA